MHSRKKQCMAEVRIFWVTWKSSRIQLCLIVFLTLFNFPYFKA